jgi:hypothetical protein
MLPTLAASESARQRFLREAQTAAAIEHDNIVPIFQVGEDRGVPFIAMPLLKGEPLDTRLERDTTLPIAEVLRIGREAAKGLAAAHAAGLVHRDIKPANLWLEGEDGRVKILDFGLARAAGDSANVTQQGIIIGTPAFMAPEQAQGRQVDARGDLFSLGCTLYRMCTDQAPVKGDDPVSTLLSVTTESPPPPREFRPELPRRLSELVMRLLAKEPEGRFASAEQVVAALQEIEREMGARAPTRPSIKKPLPVAWLVGGGTLALAALVTALVLLWPTPRGTVRIESDDPDVEIVFDKSGPTVKGAAKEPIILRAGEHGAVIKRGDSTFESDRFVLKKGETITLKVELLRGRIQVAPDGTVIAAGDIPVPPTSTKDGGKSKELAVRPAAAQPFVILARDSRPEHVCATLKDAVTEAQNGDTIEVRTNGPFQVPPIALYKYLAIRAGAGLRPVLRLDPAFRDREGQWLSVSGSLILEGLELRSDSTTAKHCELLHSGKPESALIIRHCRLVATGAYNFALGIGGVPRVEIQNSELIGTETRALMWSPGPGAKMLIDQCVLYGATQPGDVISGNCRREKFP